MQQLNSKQRSALLNDIYKFQKQELQNYIAVEDIPVPASSGARYFWHRPECIRMKNAWVREDESEFSLSSRKPPLKDIYQRYIQA